MREGQTRSRQVWRRLRICLLGRCRTSDGQKAPYRGWETRNVIGQSLHFLKGVIVTPGRCQAQGSTVWNLLSILALQLASPLLPPETSRAEGRR
jgi:hypothetical protein